MIYILNKDNFSSTPNSKFFYQKKENNSKKEFLRNANNNYMQFLPTFHVGTVEMQKMTKDDK